MATRQRSELSLPQFRGRFRLPGSLVQSQGPISIANRYATPVAQYFALGPLGP